MLAPVRHDSCDTFWQLLEPHLPGIQGRVSCPAQCLELIEAGWAACVPL